jgi:uncharacterized protein YecE (DUF72 family)
MKVHFPAGVLVGTSSWSTSDWCGSFYPESIEPAEMIRVYSSKLPTVEIDSTWHFMPNKTMVDAWNSRTPDGFIFSAKVPKVISHEKYLEDCESEFSARRIPIYIYFNNHYAGYAPGSVELFSKLFNDE